MSKFGDHLRLSAAFLALFCAVCGCVDPAIARCVQGSVVITSDADVARLADVTCILGDVTLNSTNVHSLTLPALKSVGGFFDVEANGSLTSVDLPALAIVNGEFGLTGVDAASISAPLLAETAAFSVSGNKHLTSFDFSSLTITGAIGGTSHFWMQSNLALRQCLVDRLLAQLRPRPDDIWDDNNRGLPNRCP